MTADVSVVIPCYNGQETIAAALRSVFEQTLPPTEVIVVDDGSRDASAEVVASQFPQVVLIRQENCGAAAARNTGIERARARFIAFLDADDQWLPHKLEQQLAVMDAEPQVGIVTAPTLWDDCCGTPPSATAGNAASYTIRRTADIFAHPRLCSSAVLLRREVIATVGLLDPDLGYAYDVDYFFRIIAAGWKLAYMSTPLTVCRSDKFLQDPAARSRKFARLAEHQVALIDRWDPTINPHSPLSLREHSRARSWACLQAANYLTAGECWGEARGYFLQALRETGAPLQVRAAALIGALSPRLADILLACCRRVLGRRRIN